MKKEKGRLFMKHRIYFVKNNSNTSDFLYSPELLMLCKQKNN